MSELKAYAVWDIPTRWFHWINALSVIALAGIGLVILEGAALGLTNDGKLALKIVHAWIGYAFVANLAWRIVWAFTGNRYARWNQMLPGGPGYLKALRSYVKAFVAGGPEHYLGHNPAGRIGVAILFVLLVVQAVTGLVLVGTDLFYPPIGHWIAGWIAAPGVDPSTLVPYAPDLYDKAEFARMRSMRGPVAEAHELGFFALIVTGMLHVAAVVVTELREGGSIISALFTGRKIVRGTPIDAERDAGRQQDV